MKFSISYPIKPKIVNQKFGETSTLPYYQANGIYFAGHNGIDFGAPHGAPIFASHDGTASYQIDAAQGHGVVIITNDKFEYKDGESYFKTIYWHMCDPVKEPKYASPIYKKGNVQVKEGDIIGYVNSTGLSTGDHLHYGLKPVMPGETPGTWYNLTQNEGYMGAIDPTPYLRDEFAADIKIMGIQKQIISILEVLLSMLVKK